MTTSEFWTRVKLAFGGGSQVTPVDVGRAAAGQMNNNGMRLDLEALVHEMDESDDGSEEDCAAVRKGILDGLEQASACWPADNIVRRWLAREQEDRRTAARDR